MGHAHTPADDIFYDLVSIQYHALKGAQVYEQYLKDAEGHQNVQQFISQVQEEDKRRAEQAHELLKELTREAGGGMNP
jgi:hypothetical protein